MIKVIIVDDHDIVVAGLRNLLEYDGRIRVVGTSKTAADGRKIARELNPDVIILDLRMPGSRGLDEIVNFRVEMPQAKILVLTGYGEFAANQALKMGADAFMTKELASDAIVDQICSWFPAAALLDPLKQLSDREKEVGRLAAIGLTNPEIAEQLFISVNTVKTHLGRVLEKFEVRDRTELARRWPEPL